MDDINANLPIAEFIISWILNDRLLVAQLAKA